MSDYNFEAYSPSRGKPCGHMHHSEERARNCADHLGWEDFIVRKVPRSTFKRDKVPDYLHSMFSDTNLYEMCVKVRFDAMNQSSVLDAESRIKNILQNAKSVVQVEEVYLKKVIE